MILLRIVEKMQMQNNNWKLEWNMNFRGEETCETRPRNCRTA